MKDFIGQEIREGDRAVYHHGGRYSGLANVTVLGFTPKYVKTTWGRAAPDNLIVVEQNLKALGK